MNRDEFYINKKAIEEWRIQKRLEDSIAQIDTWLSVGYNTYVIDNYSAFKIEETYLIEKIRTHYEALGFRFRLVKPKRTWWQFITLTRPEYPYLELT
jgi:hypothetical protein